MELRIAGEECGTTGNASGCRAHNGADRADGTPYQPRQKTGGPFADSLGKVLGTLHQAYADRTQ